MLTPEELAQLSGAEELFPSPIPVQFVSSDEFMPSPQSPQQKEFEARVKDIGARLAKKHGISRRKFFKTAGGMAAAFVAMNEVYAKNAQPVYEVLKNEAFSTVGNVSGTRNAKASATSHSPATTAPTPTPSLRACA